MHLSRPPAPAVWLLAVFLGLCTVQFASAQIAPAAAEPGVTWIPTQGNPEALAQLSNLKLEDLSDADKAITARAILGIVPSQQVSDKSYV